MSEEVTNPNPDPEPEGAVEVELAGQKQRMVPVSALVAERERVRKAAEEKLTKEYEPLKAELAKLQSVKSDLDAVQPYVEQLRARPELMKVQEPDELKGISDQEAETFARRYQLFTTTGLDIRNAKQIIADQRKQTREIATQAAQEAIRPLAETTSVDKSRQHFMWAAQQRDQTGNPLVDAQVLAQEWAKLPAELTANPQVAEFVLNSAIGLMRRTGKTPPPPPQFEPTFSEASGGRQGAYQISELEQKMARSQGINEKDWTTQAKQYKPGAINVLGD